jgi:hypothetical protein
MSLSKKVVYTAITGGVDTLKDDQNFDGAIPVAFIDEVVETEKWNIAPVCRIFKENNRNAKIHKVLAHQYLDCDYSLWIDGNIRLRFPIDKLIEVYLDDADIAVHKHPGRDNIFQEKEACLERNKGDPYKLKEQVDCYKKSGFDKDSLYECPVILRRHTPEVEKFNNYWWAEICRHSRRDQISFPYVVDKLGIKVNTFVGQIYNSPYFGWSHHDGVR